MVPILILAFFIGSIPFSRLISRLFKIKFLQETSSSSSGILALDTLKVWSPRLLTFLLDVGKGVLAVLLATPVGYEVLSATFPLQILNFNGESSLALWWVTGAFAILGNCFSPWSKLDGGKGIDIGLGVLLVLSPVSALFGIFGFVVTYLFKKSVSFASISGLMLASIAYVVLNPVGVHLWVGAAMVLLILIRHEEDLDLLLAKEPRLKAEVGP